MAGPRICACHSGALPPPGEQWTGWVHSVYARALNLALAPHRLVTVSPMADGRGPCAIHVAGTTAPAGHQPGERVVLTRTMVCIGPWQADIPAQGVYQLSRGTLRGTPGSWAQGAIGLARRLEAEQARVDTDPIWAATQARIVRWCRVLEERFAQADRPGIVAAGRELLGLGQGLTPSGDDVLTGLFALLGLEGSPLAETDQLLGRIIRGQRAQTTDVSWQMLSAAAAGEYKQVLVDCAQALAGQGADHNALVERVLGIGHSSGRDLLLGCLTALRILQHHSDNN